MCRPGELVAVAFTETASETGEANSTERENEWVTVAKKRGTRDRKLWWKIGNH